MNAPWIGWKVVDICGAGEKMMRDQSHPRVYEFKQDDAWRPVCPELEF
jgi:hypothetical protein